MAKSFNSLLRAYIPNFDSLVKSLLKGLGLPTVYSGVIIYEQPDDSSCSLKVSFQGLPQRPGSVKGSTENVFITAMLSGAVKDGKAHLTHYGTEIGYYRQTSASRPLCDLLPITGYHYDFDCDGKKFNHPVFHAQPKATAGDRYIRLSRDITHQGYPHSDELRTIRIPTPQMDIFSSIVMILADHVILPDDPKRKFGDFLESFEKNMIRFDLESIEKLVSTSFFNANLHRIHSWYPKPAAKQSTIGL